MPGVSDVRILLTPGHGVLLAKASFRYYAMPISHVRIYGDEDGRQTRVSLPEYYDRFLGKGIPILHPPPSLEAEIKTAILRAYRAEVARKEAA